MSHSNRITAGEVAAVLREIVEDPSFPRDDDDRAAPADKPSTLALVKQLEASERPDEALSGLANYVTKELETIGPSVDVSPSAEVGQIIAELGSTSRIGPRATDALPRLIEIGRKAPYINVESGVSNVLKSRDAISFVAALGSSKWPPR
jgi:hypothetical protein